MLAICLLSVYFGLLWASIIIVNLIEKSYQDKRDKRIKRLSENKRVIDWDSLPMR